MSLLDKAVDDTSRSLYDRNRAVYDLLRYAVKGKPSAGKNTVDVWLIDWVHPENNHFAIAKEVTVAAARDKAHPKRPDVVLYNRGATGSFRMKRRANTSTSSSASSRFIEIPLTAWLLV